MTDNNVFYDMRLFSKRPEIALLVWMFLILISGLAVHFVQNLAIAFVAIMVMLFLTFLLIFEWLTGIAQSLFFEFKDVNILQSTSVFSEQDSFSVKDKKKAWKIPQNHFWGLIGAVLAILPIVFQYGFLKNDWQASICFGPFLIFAGFLIGYISGPFLLSITTMMVLTLANPLHIKPSTIGEYLLPIAGMGIGYLLFTWPAIKLTDRFSFIVKPVRPQPTTTTVIYSGETSLPNNSPQKKQIDSTSRRKQVGIGLMVITIVSIIAKALMTKRRLK